MKILVFASGRGSNARAIFQAIKNLFRKLNFKKKKNKIK